MRKFRYLRDPLFLFAVAAFLVNRFVLERIWSSGFVHNHVNDLLCVAFLVPVMLTLMKCCGLRNNDGPPRTAEIVIPVLVWGLFFEVLLPLHPFWGQWATADPADILCYWTGGLAAAIIWRFRLAQPAVDLAPSEFSDSTTVRSPDRIVQSRGHSPTRWIQNHS
jgi:hypothetical protein